MGVSDEAAAEPGPHRAAEPGADGAYGLRLPDLAASGLLNAGHAGAPLVRVDQRPGDGEEPTGMVRLAPGYARFEIEPGVAEVTRGGASDGRYGTIEFATERPVDAAHLVHPFLARPVAMLSRWMGRHTFHGGAFLVGDGAWIVVGDREAGKSTLLATVAARGHPVMCDDVTVVEDGRVLAGPRTVDLRPDGGERISGAADLGVVGLRQRARLVLGPVPAAAPVAGWVVPDWSESIGVEEMRLREHPVVVTRSMTLLLDPVRPEALLDLAARPMVRFARPRDWSAADEAVGALVEALSRLA